MGKTVALHNLGCKVNAYETEVMTKQLEEAGYEIVNFNEKADVYIINTCSVTNIADRKSRQMLHRAKKLNKDACVVAAGCYVQGAREEMEKDAAVDVIVSNNRKGQIVDIINNYFEEKDIRDKNSDINEINESININNEIKSCKEYFIDINKTSEYEDMTLTDTGEKTRAYMKIQDGCNQFCSYCIIPFVRGRIRSRSIESIVKEAEGLALRGYKEIVLTGIHISSYGKDYLKDKVNTKIDNNDVELDKNSGKGLGSALKDENDYLSLSQDLEEVIEDNKNILSLIDVIEAVSNVDGIKRIRLGSLEPRIITDNFVQRLVKQTKVCPHFHLSLQSGCDETLARMNRHYTCDEYEESCNILRKYYDDPAISTDVIVGFPGETDEEFKTTHAFLKRIAFAKMHIFKYSRRKGTRADKMPNQISDSVKQVRSEDLLSLEQNLAYAYINRNLGKEEEILLEEVIEVSGRDYMTGYTSTYVKVAVPIDDGKVYGVDVLEANGKIIKVKLDRELESELVLVNPIEWVE
ncbi:threonylcarbamoyladenosine tRNA methylthiotransferase MtaB [Eubacterium uniforme]|uniref:Threonylcarbamoyladenosine tRNA methylthiotransferase MtaB n=1 Tax=Eubacterium uniforme TaxID=39495 RepID=A0A1T4VNB6_9FIRM|nr:MiaB/RimO family radical SAM methylthiotransferase [Eubacterium uniforme]SKA66460.1 threonylcarbamoyladenosine tRNA methylthiotransferase MtaB [Eubacterium uniforme]